MAEVAHADQATNGKELFNFAVAAEERGDLSEDDKRRVRSFVEEAVLLIDKGRDRTCSWYQFGCKASNRRRSLKED